MIAFAGCQHESAKKNGKDRKGQQRYKCLDCGKTWIARTVRPIGEMRIGMDRALLVLNMLLEGMSIRACERITRIHRDTIDDLILVVGENCQRFLDREIRDVEATDVQVDEIWSFVLCKAKHAKKKGYGPEVGDSWTFIAIDRNTKMILSHQVGHRDDRTAKTFLRKLRSATTGRFQVTSDGLSSYTYNVPLEFKGQVDFAQLIKQYRSSQSETRYSPENMARRSGGGGTGDRSIVRSTSAVSALSAIALSSFSLLFINANSRLDHVQPIHRARY